MKGKLFLKIGIFAALFYLFMYYWETVAKFLGTLFGAAMPLIIGAMIAYFVNILMCFYERHYFPKSQKTIVKKTRRPLCLVAAVLTLMAIIILVFSIVLPQLLSCINQLLSAIPWLLERFISWMGGMHILSQETLRFLQEFDWQSRIGEIAKVLTSGVGDVMNVVISVVTSVVSGAITAFISIIFSLYLLAGKDRICAQVKRLFKHYLPEKTYEKVRYFVRVLNDSFHRYIVGQCTEAVILGLLCTVFMFVFRLPYATMIGALIAFTALIPIAGAYIGALLGALMILAVSPVKALVFLILIVVLQQLEGNLIYPKVVGASIGLPGIWVLAAVTIGGGMLGVIGMLLGVPLAAALYRILKEDASGKVSVFPKRKPE